jgi:two-component system LytT family response regulator
LGIDLKTPLVLDVIIVDDEPAARRSLREFCAREADLRIVGQYGDGRSALEAIRAQPPGLLFLDIQMDLLNGIALARALDPQTLPLIVFVTAFDHYAVEAFEVCAIDYLLKPFDYERFSKSLVRVRRRHATESLTDRQTIFTSVLQQLQVGAAAAAPRILAESGSRMHVINVTDVEVVEADRNYVKITVGREIYHARSTLQQAEKSLQSQPMLRVSRFCLVNMRHVNEISRTARGDVILILAGGTTFTSSEGFRESVRNYLDTLKISPR